MLGTTPLQWNTDGGEHGRHGDRRLLLSRAESGGAARLVRRASWRRAPPYGMWQTQAGPSVFAPFAADTDYFAADRQWMLNLRVDDLDGLLRHTARGGDRGDHQSGVGHAGRRSLRAHPRSRGQSDRTVATSRNRVSPADHREAISTSVKWACSWLLSNSQEHGSHPYWQTGAQRLLPVVKPERMHTRPLAQSALLRHSGASKKSSVQVFSPSVVRQQ